MYTAPDFVKVAVKVEDSFAAYNCPPDTVKGFIEGICDASTENFQSMLEIFPSATYQCYHSLQP